MFSSHLILNDFVCPIPICQPEADLGTILRIFQHSNCDLLAIPLGNSSWGTISSKTLLSLLVHFSHQQANSTIGRLKSLSPEVMSLHVARKELNQLIEPAIICQSDIKLEEFWIYLKESSLSKPETTETKYLIVNSHGNLQGALNIEKLLKSWIDQSNLPQAVNPGLSTAPASINSINKRIVALIESIPLPLKLETAEGKDLFMNPCWQKLIDMDQGLDSQKSQKKDMSTALWSVKYQQSQYQDYLAQKNSNYDHQLRSLHETSCLCLTSDCHVISPIDIAFPHSFEFGSEHLKIETAHHAAPSCLLDNEPIKSATNSPFNIQIEQEKDWSYLKIPLNFLVAEKFSSTTNTIGRLVMAIKSPSKDADEKIPDNVLTFETLTSTLLTTISHELKSPLTGIVGLSSLLKVQKLGKLNQRQTRYVQLIHDSGQKLMSIVGELLTLTNLTPDNLPLKPELVDLDSLCRQVYQKVITKLKAKSEASSDLMSQAPQLLLDIELGLELAIAEKSRLSTILSHLVMEIVQFSKPLNSLEIKIRSLQDGIAISISNDHQAAFSSSEQATDPLKLLSEDSSSLKEQSSLSLIIAKYLAKVLEGEVLSNFGGDSCQFTLLLPESSLQPAHVPPNSNPVIPQYQSHAAKVDTPLVILINNNLVKVNDLTRKLKELGYKTILVRTGIEALKQIRKLKPECIFMNPRLPDLHGKDLLSLLKLDSSTQDIPVFIFTPTPDQPQYQYLYQQANGFIATSPNRFTLENILPKVQKSPVETKQNLTILCLYPEPEVINSDRPNTKNNGLDFNLKKWAEQDWSSHPEQQIPCQHRIIEAEGLEQAHTLARIWQLDVIVLDGHQIATPTEYLHTLQESEYLAALPLVTLDTKTTEAANQIENLNVYPCLLPAQCRRISDLMQVIQIATSLE